MTKIGSRKVPTETDLVIRGERRPFRTALKTCKKFGVLYYGPTVMPSDLGLAAFSEDIKETKNE